MHRQKHPQAVLAGDGLAAHLGDRDRLAEQRLGGGGAERDDEVGRSSLERLEEAARTDANLLPPLIDAVRAYATVGEISDRLRTAWGEHRELITV